LAALLAFAFRGLRAAGYTPAPRSAVRRAGSVTGQRSRVTPERPNGNGGFLPVLDPRSMARVHPKE
jgi:hypothetical protein